MPIRINLLAEQQAAEEARRRDPVKRAFWAGGTLAALMVLWSVSLQLRLASARAELSRNESKLQLVEENSKGARLDWATHNQLDLRLANLQRYSTNRFFCATALDAIQQVMLDDMRVMEVQSAHTYSTNAASTLKTNLVIPIASHSAWQFWKARPVQTNVWLLVSNQVALLSNKLESLKAPVELVTKIDLSTNQQQITAKIDITRPAVAAEQIVLTIKARDYGNSLGKRVDEFSKAIATHPYFVQRLRQGEGEGIRLRERAIQPEFDLADPVNPNRPFIPFVIECRYRDTLRTNE